MAKRGYKVKSFMDNHVVHETNTATNIFHTSYLKRAKEVAYNCNSGNGFKGHTPAFFTRRIDPDRYKQHDDNLYEEIK